MIICGQQISVDNKYLWTKVKFFPISFVKSKIICIVVPIKTDKYEQTFNYIIIRYVLSALNGTGKNAASLGCRHIYAPEV